MKQKISVTVEEDVLKLIEKRLKEKDKAFRNRSHVIEYSLNKFLENAEED